MLSGGAGDDDIQGDCHIVPIVHTSCKQTGDDRIQGDSGKDELFGDTGKDTILGGAGDDYLLGSDDDDDLQGGDDNDILWGENADVPPARGQRCRQPERRRGRRRAEGRDGNAPRRRPGNDTLDGMEGDDRLLSDPLGSDELSGDAGIDTLDLSDRTADLLITIGTGEKGRAMARRARTTRPARPRRSS